MHHTEVEIRLLVRIRLAEHPEEVTSYFTHLKEFLYFIRHVNVI